MTSAATKRPPAGKAQPGPNLIPPERGTLADEVVAQLRAAIHRGDFAPGEHLSEDALARLLEVSRGPVRDALKQLEREGLVVSQPNGRKFVARMTHQDVEEIYSLRLVLERLAVRSACHSADAAKIARLGAVIQSMEVAVSNGIGEREAAELDLSFHDALYEASNHKRLIEFWSILRPQVLSFLHSRNASRDDFAEILVPYHRELFDAIAARDKRNAVKLIGIHIRSSYEPLIRSYD